VKKKRSRKIAAAEPDGRVQRSKKAVLAAAHQLLTEAGLGGVTVDEVSKRSGVAKTTIYRHWPSRSELLLEACSQMGTRPQAPDTGSFRGDLEMLVKFLAHQLRTAAWVTAAPSIVDAAERDDDLAKIQAEIHCQMRSPFQTVVERAQQRGELSRDVDPSHVVAAIFGPMYYRRWFSREPLNEAFMKSVVERIAGGSV
jgi:AcrR family transcriptional regulator